MRHKQASRGRVQVDSIVRTCTSNRVAAYIRSMNVLDGGGTTRALLVSRLAAIEVKVDCDWPSSPPCVDKVLRTSPSPLRPGCRISVRFLEPHHECLHTQSPAAWRILLTIVRPKTLPKLNALCHKLRCHASSTKEPSTYQPHVVSSRLAESPWPTLRICLRRRLPAQSW